MEVSREATTLGARDAAATGGEETTFAGLYSAVNIQQFLPWSYRRWRFSSEQNGTFKS